MIDIKEKIKFKDKCELCFEWKYNCKGYKDKVICEECYSKLYLKNNNKKSCSQNALIKQLLLFEKETFTHFTLDM